MFHRLDASSQQAVRQQVLGLGLKTQPELERDPSYVNKRSRRLILPRHLLASQVAGHFNKWADQGIDPATGSCLWTAASAKAVLNLLARILAGRYTGERYSEPLQCQAHTGCQLNNASAQVLPASNPVEIVSHSPGHAHVSTCVLSDASQGSFLVVLSLLDMHAAPPGTSPQMEMPQKPDDPSPPILRPVLNTSNVENANRWLQDAMPDTCGPKLALDIQMSHVTASNIRAGMP